MNHERRIPLVIAHKLLDQVGAGVIDLDEFKAECDHWPPSWPRRRGVRARELFACCAPAGMRAGAGQPVSMSSPSAMSTSGLSPVK